MNSVTSTNVVSTATSHTSDAAAKQSHDVKGGNNSKDSDSEGEGAEEVCQRSILIYLRISNMTL